MNVSKFLEYFFISIRNISSNKARSFLTMLGVLIGVASVIALMSVGIGAQKSIEENIKKMGANLLTISSGARRGFGVMRSPGDNKPVITPEDIKDIESLVPDLITVYAPDNSQNQSLKFGNNNLRASVVGTSEHYPAIRNYSVQEGVFISEDDVRSKRKVVVLGYEAALQLFGEDANPIGEKIRVGKISATVIGTMTSKGDNSDTRAYIPYTTFQRYVSGGKNFSSLSIQVVSEEQMKTAQNAIEALLLENHNLSDMDSADFSVMNMQDLMSSLSSVTATFTMLLGSIAGISLLVGGIGIMNIMLVSVTERTREIGINGPGAKSRDILAQFLIESVVLSALGGILGIAFGILASFLIQKYGNTTTAVTLSPVVLSFSFAILTGLFFGSYPAYRASNLVVVDALRYE